MRSASEHAEIRGGISARRLSLPISERKVLLTGVDLLAVNLALVISLNLRTSEVRHQGFTIAWLNLAIGSLLWLAAAHMAAAYNLRAAAQMRATLRSIGSAVAITSIGLLGVFLLFPFTITRPTILLWIPIAFILLVLGRLAYQRSLGDSYFAGQIVLVMSPERLEQIWPDLQAQLEGLYRVHGIVDPAEPHAGDRLESLVRSGRVASIVIGARDEVPRDLFHAIVSCHDAGVPARSLSDLYEESTGRLLLDQLGHGWLLSLPMRNQTSNIYSALKRAIDLVAAIIALLVFAPLFPLCAAAIWIEDRGPIFHRQLRVGRYNRPLRIVKLRTMRGRGGGEGDDLHWTDQGDPRITHVGRVLRVLHLDELPQAWSILTGQMSIVGPRPEQRHYVNELQSSIDFYGTRHTVRPGLTGWAQVNQGYSSSISDSRVKLSYDLYYVKRQSLTLDLLILARTAVCVVSLKGR